MGQRSKYNIRNERLFEKAIIGSLVLHLLGVGALRLVEPSAVLNARPALVDRFAVLERPDEPEAIVTVELGSQEAGSSEPAAEPPSEVAPEPAGEPERVDEPEVKPAEPTTRAPEPDSAPGPIPAEPVSTPEPMPAADEVAPPPIETNSEAPTPRSGTASAQPGRTPTTPPRDGERGPSGPSAGQGASSGAPSGGAAVDKRALRRGYMGQLGLKINRKYFYPKIAQRLGQEGRVLVAIEIDATGRIVKVSIHQKCAHKRLNDAALSALRKLHSVPPPPSALLVGGHLRVIVPMVYSL